MNQRFDLIQAPLDPPEDTRRVFDSCAICEDPIFEGDDAWDIPNYGYCCERCIKDARIIEVEVDD